MNNKILEEISDSRPVLVLGAHPDDELGCGGTIARLSKARQDIHHYYFSSCEESLKNLGLEKDQLKLECEKSRNILGIDSRNCGSFDFPVRYFPRERQEILETLIKLRTKINPGLVFVPNEHDIHQDHHVIYSEAVRTFKHATILGYEMPWNTLQMDHDCLIRLSPDDLGKKLEALACYESQMGRSYANQQFFEALAKVRGVQANAEFAECFQVIRLFL